MNWLWILLGIVGILALVLVGGVAYMYRFGLCRRPFPWSKEYRDPWAKRPTGPRIVDGQPFNPGGWGDAIVEMPSWRGKSGCTIRTMPRAADILWILLTD